MGGGSFYGYGDNSAVFYCSDVFKGKHVVGGGKYLTESVPKLIKSLGECLGIGQPGGHKAFELILIYFFKIFRAPAERPGIIRFRAEGYSINRPETL